MLVLGDSHTLVFKHDLFRLAFPLTRFEVCSVGGATVSGLENPNSKTQALQTFHAALERVPTGTKTILMLGEVDTGFVIWYRAKKYNDSVECMLEQATANYVKFIDQVAQKCSPIVVSTPLPTIRDGENFGEVANQRKAVTSSQQERTALTVHFNQMVEAYCEKNRVPFLNLDEVSSGRDGLVLSTLLNPDESNHHYKSLAHAQMMIPRLRKFL